MDSDVYDEKDETQLNFLESTITGAVSIKAKLKAVKDVEVHDEEGMQHGT